MFTNLQFQFELRGETPMLMHQDDVMLADELDAWRKAPENKNLSKAGDDRSPPWTWQTYCYNDGKYLAMPSGNIMVCLRSAGAQLILKKQKTFKEITQSGLFIVDEYCRFVVNGRQIEWAEIEALRDLDFKKQADAAQNLGFSLFVKRARVGSSKHVRVRARFNDWAVQGTIIVKVPEITAEILSRLFEIAGTVGLNDWRPGCKTPGPYGMFSGKIQQMKSKAA